LWRAGDRIGIAPASLVSPELFAEIQLQKPQLLDLLDARAAGVSNDCRPWLHIARQVKAGEFDGGDRSLLMSLLIGLRSVAHPLCQSAKGHIESLLRCSKGVKK
jgi:hypothetical protein